MKVSKKQVAERRLRILEAAGRLFREHGFDAVTVADVMKAAGLTHGAFYGHFQSKDDLIAQTLAHSFAGQRAGSPDLLQYAAKYLTPEHRDDIGAGCTTAALGAETIRQSPQARATVSESLRRLIEFLSTGTAGDESTQRRNAIASYAAMVGAMILARVSDNDPELSDEIIEQTRAWIMEKAAVATVAR